MIVGINRLLVMYEVDVSVEVLEVGRLSDLLHNLMHREMTSSACDGNLHASARCRETIS